MASRSLAMDKPCIPRLLGKHGNGKFENELSFFCFVIQCVISECTLHLLAWLELSGRMSCFAFNYSLGWLEDEHTKNASRTAISLSLSFYALLSRDERCLWQFVLRKKKGNRQEQSPSSETHLTTISILTKSDFYSRLFESTLPSDRQLDSSKVTSEVFEFNLNTSMHVLLAIYISKKIVNRDGTFHNWK